jgi:hypothetical protein
MNQYFKPAQFWTTLASVIVGGIIVGILVYGYNPLDNVKKITFTDENKSED